jgi:CRISPR-associated protein Cmr2
LEQKANQWADRARNELARLGPNLDKVWQAIWERQLGALWETYWAAAPLAKRDYAEVYQETRKALGACKRTRVFSQVQETGPKDTFGGTRAALRTADRDARAYWAAVAKNTTAAQLKPDGRERLDAAGALKRFGGLADRIPSTSTVAAAGFLARTREGNQLAPYRQVLEALLGRHLYRVAKDPDWPYDGDLLYEETLAAARLRASYGVEQVDAGRLSAAVDALRAIYRRVGPPSLYYALIVLDGDGMGQRVEECSNPEEHRALSEKVSWFARSAKDVVKKVGDGARLVYAGGDDVLALAPLATALPLAWELAKAFTEKVGAGATASAGVAMAHHLYPLDATLRAAREAEAMAKRVEGKNAVGVAVLKRSGERLEMASPWAPVRKDWDELRGRLERGELASGFVGDATDVDLLLTISGALEADLRRLLRRHSKLEDKDRGDRLDLAPRLAYWAAELEARRAGSLKPWIELARFVAKGGTM